MANDCAWFRCRCVSTNLLHVSRAAGPPPPPDQQHLVRQPCASQRPQSQIVATWLLGSRLPGDCGEPRSQHRLTPRAMPAQHIFFEYEEYRQKLLAARTDGRELLARGLSRGAPAAAAQ